MQKRRKTSLAQTALSQIKLHCLNSERAASRLEMSCTDPQHETKAQLLLLQRAEVGTDSQHMEQDTAHRGAGSAQPRAVTQLMALHCPPQIPASFLKTCTNPTFSTRKTQLAKEMGKSPSALWKTALTANTNKISLFISSPANFDSSMDRDPQVPSQLFDI